MHTTEASDLELIEGITQESQDSLALFVNRHRDRVLRTAYAYTRNWHDAEDIAQEVFVKVYRRAGQFRGRAEISTWLYRIVVNESMDYLRKRKRTPQKSHGESDRNNEGSLAGIASSRPGVRRESESREIVRLMDAAVMKLPSGQQSVFTLFYTQELSIENIAEILGVTTGSVKAQLWQAREKIKKELLSLGFSFEGRIAS